MRFKILIIILLTGTLLGAEKQSHLPPVFGSEYAGKSQKNELTEIYLTPQRIVWKNDKNGSLVKNEELLLEPGTGQADLTRKKNCILITTDRDTASILLDYGKEIHGGLQLVLSTATVRKPPLIRIRFGESVGECNSDITVTSGAKGFSTNHHAMRDMLIEVPKEGVLEVGNTGFRFVRIDLLEPNTTLNVREVRAIFRFRDIPYLGSFKSNDERLNQIWLTGAYTTHLNMQEYLWDGIKRDRVVWLGDMHPEVATILTVFGANEVVPNTLDYACNLFPLPAWMNNMSPYSMWYLIIQKEWYLKSGNIDFLKKHRDYILGLIDLTDSRIDEQGKEQLGKLRFLDWPSSPNTKGVEAGFRALIVWAMKDAVELCRILKVPEYADKAAHVIEKLNKDIQDPNQLKQAAAMMTLAGIMDADKACKEVISVGGAQGFSTFYGYYMLQAQAMAGEYQTALDIIRQFWGAMLDRGATTFWEDFDLSWLENTGRIDELTPPGLQDIHGANGAYCYLGYRHSLCHGWSSGPTAWLSEHVLGVKAVEPGYKKVKIEPHLGDLEWVEGTFPTPYGIIEIKHTKDANGKINSNIKAPKGVKIIR